MKKHGKEETMRVEEDEVFEAFSLRFKKKLRENECR